MSAITTAELLNDAAALIRRSGLAQGVRAMTGEGLAIGVYVKAPVKRHCLQGAVIATFENARKRGLVLNDGEPRWGPVVLAELARRGLPRRMDEFNDAPGRTAEEVAELLESAARRAMAESKA